MAGERGRQGFITTQWQGFREAGHRWQERGTGGKREAVVQTNKETHRENNKRRSREAERRGTER